MVLEVDGGGLDAGTALDRRTHLGWKDRLVQAGTRAEFGFGLGFGLLSEITNVTKYRHQVGLRKSRPRESILGGA